MTNFRSAASLLASGAATITLSHRLRIPRILSTAEAFRADRNAIKGDVERAISKATGGRP